MATAANTKAGDIYLSHMVFASTFDGDHLEFLGELELVISLLAKRPKSEAVISYGIFLQREWIESVGAVLKKLKQQKATIVSTLRQQAAPTVDAGRLLRKMQALAREKCLAASTLSHEAG